MVTLVQLRKAESRQLAGNGRPICTYAASLALGLILGCQPDSDGALIRLDPREVVITAHSPGVYLAWLTTSFRPDDGPRGQEYSVTASNITLVTSTRSGSAEFDDATVWVTITPIEEDGSDGLPFVDAWSLAALAGEGDTGEAAPPHIHVSYYEQTSDSGLTPLEIDLRIEFETDSQVPVRLRWYPVGYVRMSRLGCIGTDGWVELDVEAQPGTSDQVVEAGDTG